MSLIEFIHNLVHFCLGHVASLQLALLVDGLQNIRLQVSTTDRGLYILQGHHYKTRKELMNYEDTMNY